MRRDIGNPSRDGEEALANQGTDQHEPTRVVELTGDVTAGELLRLRDEAQLVLECGRKPDHLAVEFQPPGRGVRPPLTAAPPTPSPAPTQAAVRNHPPRSHVPA